MLYVKVRYGAAADADIVEQLAQAGLLLGVESVAWDVYGIRPTHVRIAGEEIGTLLFSDLPLDLEGLELHSIEFVLGDIPQRFIDLWNSGELQPTLRSCEQITMRHYAHHANKRVTLRYFAYASYQG
jgi:hypothetical protein